MKGSSGKEKTGVWIGILISFFGLAAAILPAAIGLDMMRVGYGLAFIGVFIVIAGVITALVFGQRVRELDRALADENILARWTYDEGQNRLQIEEEFKRLQGSNRSLFMIMLAWFVVIGGGLLGITLFQEGEFNWFFAILFFGILALLGLVAFIAPLIWRRQAESAGREVIIARNGLVLNGAFHSWAAPLNRLVNVQFFGESSAGRLEFEIRYMSRASVGGYPTYTIHIPVPSGKEQEAEKIAEVFQDKI